MYQRYLLDDRGSALAAEGVTDAGSFTGFYWNQQLATAGLLLGLTTASGLGGALLYAASNRPRRTEPARIEAPTG